jgi:phosphoribosylformimino-5-aminoimidazole carboxamide ribotide isomerase
MPEAVIFDYGVGNLLSLKCALEKVGLNAKITVSAQQLSKADAIALPGVGNFSAAITKLDAVKEQLLTAVESGTPLLGICLGLQLFFQESEEGPGKGLALFEGKTVRLQGSVKVPHMGWNTLRIVKQNGLFEDVADEAYVYFVRQRDCGCGNRVRNNVHFSHSQQKRVWHAVSPRKIRRCRIENPKQLRQDSKKVTRELQLIPAIDLMNGKIVRLSRGDPKTAKVYDQFGGPVKTAKKWRAEGATKLHIIDLGAAFGTGDNLSVIAEIAESVELPIQVGGGIRTIETAQKLLTMGIKQVILGALAFSNPKAITQIQQKFGTETVIVALDNKDGKIMVEGWKTATTSGIKEALKKFTALKVTTFLVTSITKDGTLSGPDLETLSEACQYPNVEIIAAGGIGSLNDLVALKRVGVEGAVIGKALYEGRFTLKEALKTVGGK